VGPKPVTLIFGVGKAMQARLAKDGFHKLSDLQRADAGDLMRRYGIEGPRLARLSRGVDVRPVCPDREPKSISAETTFETDIAEFRALERRLWSLSEKGSARLKGRGLSGTTVTLKLKTADFRIRTRARGLDAPTALAAKIFAAGRDLLRREANGPRFRLIGIGVSELTPGDHADPVDLIDRCGRRAADAEHAVDRVRAKFGRDAIVKGLVFEADEER